MGENGLIVSLNWSQRAVEAFTIDIRIDLNERPGESVAVVSAVAGSSVRNKLSIGRLVPRPHSSAHLSESSRRFLKVDMR